MLVNSQQSNYRKTNMPVLLSHTTNSMKPKRNFLLLQGVIWCITDVMVFMVGPLILVNLQQTEAVVTAGCLSPAAASRLYERAPLWSHSSNHNSCSHVPPPLPPAVTSDGQSFIRPCGSVGTGPIALQKRWI